jgi:large subunit ribosomal protein L4
VLPYDQLNAYDVIVSDDIVFTKGAFDAFVAGPVKQVAAEAAEPAAPRFAKKRVSPERAAANDEAKKGKVTA